MIYEDKKKDRAPIVAYVGQKWWTCKYYINFDFLPPHLSRQKKSALKLEEVDKKNEFIAARMGHHQFRK